LADALQSIAEQMDAAGIPTPASDGSVMTHPSPAEPPATALDPSLFPPPSAHMAGFKPARQYPAPVGSPAFQPSPQLGGSYRENSYPTGHLTTPPPEGLTPSRPMSYYILLAVTAVALFAVSMFLTILVLS
jgi:hypothetical protein